jgi:hypothetical protein
VRWRKKHRRMMLIATCGLLDAAFRPVDHIFNDGWFYLLDGVILLGGVRNLIRENPHLDELEWPVG